MIFQYSFLQKSLWRGKPQIHFSQHFVKSMNTTNLVDHLKILRTVMPVRQKESEKKSKLPIFEKLKQAKRIIHDGIFAKISFCLPLLDSQNDPDNEKVTQIVRGIYFQSGQIIEYDQKMREEFAKYVLIAKQTSLEYVRQNLKGKVRFEHIISYKYIEDCLRKFQKLNVTPYILKEEDYLEGKTKEEIENAEKRRIQFQKHSEEIVSKKIKLNEHLSPKNEETYQNQSEKKHFQSPKTEQNKELKYDFIRKKHFEEGEEQNFSDQDEYFDDIDDDNPFLKLDFNENEQTEKEKLEIQARQRQTKQLETKKAEHKEKIQVQSKERFKRQLHELESKQAAKDLELKRSQQLLDKQSTDLRQKQFRRGNEGRLDKNSKSIGSFSFQKNGLICDQLMKIQKIYKDKGDIKNFAYIRAVGIIKNHDKQIKTCQDLNQVKGLSKAMKTKVKELLTTGSIQKLCLMSNKDDIIICHQLSSVWGIGAKKAKQLYDQGIRSIEELRNRPDLMNKSQRIGLKYYDELKKRIPRAKVTRMFEFVKKIFFEIIQTDRCHNIEVAGSYRRQKDTCGDVDVIFARTDGTAQRSLLQEFVSRLEATGFMTDHLSSPKPFDGHSCTAYMGICQFEGSHHRIDIKHYPIEQYPFAILYFTGSDLFNRQMRMVCHHKGLMLSDQGLRKKERNGVEKIYKGEDIPVFKNEEEIFAFLGMDYSPPWQRQI